MKQSNMPNLFFKLLMLLAVSSFFLNSCKKKETLKCKGQRVIIDGKCQCPDGKIESYGNYPDENSIRCYEKEKGQFFIDSSDCPCHLRHKEFVMLFEADELESPKYWSSAMNAHEISKIMYYKRGGSKVTIFYYKDNDSLFDHYFTISDFITGDCDKETRSFLTGKFFNNRNRLRLNVYFHNERDGFGNMSNYTSSCTMWLNNHMK
jgi:hypothetical protein